MIRKNIIKKNSVSKKFLDKKIAKRLSKRFNKFFKESIKNLNNSKNIYNILSNNYKFNFNFNKLKKFKKFQSVVIIGMGGSILGTEAIYYFSRFKIKKKFYFLNDINVEKISILKKKENLKKTLFLIISKSGNTIETLSNLFSLDLIKMKSQNIILISEKKDNVLYNLSKKFNLLFIEHKKNIGGRFSVLSEVGIIPAFFMDLNVKKLRKNTERYLLNDKQSYLKESSLIMANLLFQSKIKNLIFLNYDPHIEKFLFWCQQLVAESLGKNKKGFLPVVSNVPKDHHSLLQLYLDGPKDKIFHIFSYDEKFDKKINTKKYTNRLNYLHNKNLSKIKISQKNALIKTFKRNNIPFREFLIKNHDEETLGELFSYFILETIFVAKLSNINPFDQPAVEQVKKFTKKILS